MANYTFQDNSDIVLRKVGTNSRSAMDKAAEIMVESIQEKILYGYHDVHGNPPHTEIVDTGRLFDSIKAQVRRTICQYPQFLYVGDCRGRRGSRTVFFLESTPP